MKICQTISKNLPTISDLNPGDVFTVSGARYAGNYYMCVRSNSGTYVVVDIGVGHVVCFDLTTHVTKVEGAFVEGYEPPKP